MPNQKTHFTTGALVGATVNFIIQSAKMAMDYDRPFDWNEFFLCAGAGAFAANPKKIASFSPGLRRWPVRLGPSYPGIPASNVHNPERVASTARGSILYGKVYFAGALETAAPPNRRPFFHNLISAGLIAYGISGKHTLKLSRATRLALWVFGIGYLSHITLDSGHRTEPATFNLQPSTHHQL